MSHASHTTTSVPFSGQPFTPLPASRWQGEIGIVVGPFSSEKVAQYFAGVMLEKDPGGTTACFVFRRTDEWFVDICKRTGEAPGPAPKAAG